MAKSLAQLVADNVHHGFDEIVNLVIAHCPLRHPTQFLLHEFTQTFGDHRKILHEMRNAWHAKGRFTSPLELYNHLIDLHIAPEKAENYKLCFAESFAPEHTTGFYSKHREPLIEALVHEYVEHMHGKGRPVFRVEGDIGNLGGLNQALNNRAITDEVIGTLSGIVRETLLRLGDIIPLRKGGDEIGVILIPHEGVDIAQARAALSEAQEIVAAFVKAAGLQNIAHLKYPNEPSKSGVNLGLAIEVETTHVNRHLQQMALDADVALSKLQYDKLLHSPAIVPTPPDLARVRAVLDSYAFCHFRSQLEGEQKTYIVGHIVPGQTPEQARHTQMKRLLNPTTPAEERALDGTHALTAKRDPTNGLPMFGEMQGELLPHFMAHHGERRGAKLLHIDFNNMAGGNVLGMAVGDAMSKRYAQCVQNALVCVGLSEFSPYLASKPGGKFALLLPSDLTYHLPVLYQAIEMELFHTSLKPLPLPYEVWRRIKNNLISNPDFKIKYGYSDADIAKLRAHGLTINQIRNPKASMLQGAMVFFADSDIVYPNPSLGDVMRKLEQQTEQTQARVISERIAYVIRTTTPQPGNSDRIERCGRREAPEDHPKASQNGACPSAGSNAPNPSPYPGFIKPPLGQREGWQ